MKNPAQNPLGAAKPKPLTSNRAQEDSMKRQLVWVYDAEALAVVGTLYDAAGAISDSHRVASEGFDALFSSEWHQKVENAAADIDNCVLQLRSLRPPSQYDQYHRWLTNGAEETQMGANSYRHSLAALHKNQFDRADQYLQDWHQHFAEAGELLERAREWRDTMAPINGPEDLLVRTGRWVCDDGLSKTGDRMIQVNGRLEIALAMAQEKGAIPWTLDNLPDKVPAYPNLAYIILRPSNPADKRTLSALHPFPGYMVLTERSKLLTQSSVNSTWVPLWSKHKDMFKTFDTRTTAEAVAKKCGGDVVLAAIGEWNVETHDWQQTTLRSVQPINGKSTISRTSESTRGTSSKSSSLLQKRDFSQSKAAMGFFHDKSYDEEDEEGGGRRLGG